MFSKIMTLAALVVATQAYGHSLGPAISSQSRHDVYGHGYGYASLYSHGYSSYGHGYYGVASYGHGHGHAISSQSVVRHDGHGYAAPYAHGYSGASFHGHGYAAAVSYGHYGNYTPAHTEHYSYPKYDYANSVSESHTGDHKNQHESRDGDHIYGSYSLVQPDGSVRKVDYSANAHSGFNAVVHTSAPLQHDAPGYHHY